MMPEANDKKGARLSAFFFFLHIQWLVMTAVA